MAEQTDFDIYGDDSVGPPEDSLDYGQAPEQAPSEDQALEQVMQAIADDVGDRLARAEHERNPEVQAARAREEAEQHAHEAHAQRLADRFPELHNMQNAQRAIDATTRVASELGQLGALANDPAAYWRLVGRVHEGMSEGLGGDALRQRVASQAFLEAIAPAGRALPGENAEVDIFGNRLR